MVQCVAPAAPARRLAACDVHARQPPAADDFGAGRLGRDETACGARLRVP
jgi:hypothetical protein